MVRQNNLNSWLFELSCNLERVPDKFPFLILKDGLEVLLAEELIFFFNPSKESIVLRIDIPERGQISEVF